MFLIHKLHCNFEKKQKETTIFNYLVFLLFCFSWIFFSITPFYQKRFQDPISPFLEKHVPFVTIKPEGQLGNQLFQMATTIALALENKAEYFLPEKCLEIEKQNLAKNMEEVFFRLPVKRIHKYLIRHKHKERVFAPFSPIAFKPNMRLSGFYESEKHFIKHKEKILKLFAPSEKILSYLEGKYGFLLKHPKTVALHVRTFYKDFLLEGPSIYKNFPAPDLLYYQKAADLFEKDSLFIIFSDSIPWCKKNLNLPGKKLLFIENEEAHHDLYLMSLCKSVITSPSTFSWWGAYLNPYKKKKVIARSPWFLSRKRLDSDIILKDWIVIEGNPSPPIPSFP